MTPNTVIYFNFFSDFACSRDDNLSFLSGCHAGCSSMIGNDFYGNCSCLSQPEKFVTLGTCSNNDCNHVYIYLAVILFFQVLFTFMGTIPGLVAGLRWVLDISCRSYFFILVESLWNIGFVLPIIVCIKIHIYLFVR